MVIALFLATMCSHAFPAQEGPAIWIDPELTHDPALGPDSVLRVTVRIAIPLERPVSALGFKVTWDRTLLDYDGSVLGDFFGDDGIYIRNGLNDAGDYEMLGALMIAPKTGEFSVVRLNFIVKERGTTEFTLGPYTNSFVAGPAAGAPDEPHEYEILSVQSGVFSNLAFIPAPAQLTQAERVGGAAKPAGFVDDDGVVVMAGTVPGVDGQRSSLQVEVKYRDEPFDGRLLYVGSLAAVGGGTSTVSTLQLPEGRYHWRARSIIPRVAASEWVSFPVVDGTAFMVPAPQLMPVELQDINPAGKGKGCSAGAAGRLPLLLLALAAAYFSRRASAA